jgi:hypothetical protein
MLSTPELEPPYSSPLSWPGHANGVAAITGHYGPLRTAVTSVLRRRSEVFTGVDQPERLAETLRASREVRRDADIPLILVTELRPPGLLTALCQRRRLQSMTTDYENLVEVASDLGTTRLVVCSSAFLYGDDGGRRLRPTAPVERQAAAAGALAAERAAQRFHTLGGSAVVLRFGWVYDEQDLITSRVLATARKGWRLLDGAGEDVVPAISPRDAATAVLAALAVPPGTYNVSDGRSVTSDDINAALEEITGQRLHPLYDLRWGAGGLFGVSRNLDDMEFRDLTSWRPQDPSLSSWLRHTPFRNIGDRSRRATSNRCSSDRCAP